MNEISSKILVITVVVAALLAVVLPVPVSAESGTVSVSGPDSASPGEEVTVSFKITNTGNSPSQYILDLSLPDGYIVTGHTDDDGVWNSGDNKWLWQTIEPGNSNAKLPAVNIKLPENASKSDNITAELKTLSGVEETTSIPLIKSGSNNGNLITGEVTDVNFNSIKNTGDTELTISRTDGSGISGPILVESVPLSDFNTLALTNNDVTSASFSQDGNSPATYSIKLANDKDLSQYQITADRTGYEKYKSTTEPIGAGEAIDQNLRFALNIVEENTVSITGSEVTIATDGATSVSVTEIPNNVEVTEISDTGSITDEGIQYSDLSGLPKTVTFRLNPDDSVYSVGTDTIDFVVDGSPVSLNLVNGSKVQISNVELTPGSVASGGSTHTLSFNVENLSPDGEADEFTIAIPDTVNVEESTIVDAGKFDPSTIQLGNEITFLINPTEKTDVKVVVELTLSTKTD